MRRLFFLLLSLAFNFNMCAHYTDLPGKAVKHLLKKIREEDGINIGCVGGAMMGDIQVISLYAEAEMKLTMPQVRELILNKCDQFTNAINQNVEIRPYLHDYPFKFHNIELFISFHGFRGSKIKTPYIAGAVVTEGKILYIIYDQEGKILMPEISETYEDVCKAFTQ